MERDCSIMRQQGVNQSQLFDSCFLFGRRYAYLEEAIMLGCRQFPLRARNRACYASIWDDSMNEYIGREMVQ